MEKKEFSSLLSPCVLPEDSIACMLSTQVLGDVASTASPLATPFVQARLTACIRNYASFRISHSQYIHEMVALLPLELVGMVNSSLEIVLRDCHPGQRCLLPNSLRIYLIEPQPMTLPQSQITYIQPLSFPQSSSSSSSVSPRPASTFREAKTEPAAVLSISRVQMAAPHQHTVLPAKRASINIVDMTHSPEATLGWAQVRKLRKSLSNRRHSIASPPSRPQGEIDSRAGFQAGEDISPSTTSASAREFTSQNMRIPSSGDVTPASISPSGTSPEMENTLSRIQTGGTEPPLSFPPSFPGSTSSSHRMRWHNLM